MGLAVVTALAVGYWQRKTPPRDPVAVPTVEPFRLLDTEGRPHGPAEWRDASAVVLFVTGPDDPGGAPAAREVARLAAKFGPEGVMFYGVWPDPSADGPRVEALGLPCPVLLDPAQELIADLGLRATPAAAVLDSQGHLLDHGPVGRLERAIVAALAGEAMPVESSATAGRPLPTPAPLIGTGQEVSYHEDVAPILGNRCAGCHRRGEVGPFPLLSYADASKRAGFLAEAASSRAMPPWRTVHGYGDFHDVGRLTRRELAVLDRWAELGAPEGNPAEAAAPPRFTDGWQLGKPDAVVTMPEPFPLPADTSDIYRVFVIPIPVDRDVAVATVEFRPGNRRVAHHARFYVDTTGECRGRDAADAMPGFGVWGGGDIRKAGLGAWVPGQIPRLPPEGVGRIVREGSDLVMLVHYHGTGKPETDTSSLGLYFCKTPPTRKVVTVSLSADDIDIPPGARRHRMTLSRTVAADASALSVLPHGHKLMREISLTATLPGGKVVPMLWVNDWSFEWQGQYHFARPLRLPKGTRLDLVAYFDNSADNPANPNSPPRRVKFGLASDDEMLGCHVELVPADEAAARVYDKLEPFGL